MFDPENLSISGARAFISLEHPNEMKLYEEKREAAKRVDSAADYLGGTFWNYVYDKDRYVLDLAKHATTSQHHSAALKIT